MKIEHKQNHSVLLYTRFLFIIGMVFTFLSCEDALEEHVYSYFTEDNFYTSVQSAELGRWGVYDILGTEDLYGRGYLLYFDTGTDEERFYRQGLGNDDDLLANYQIEESNGWIGQAWTAFYTGIYRANQVIEQVTRLRDEDEAAGLTNNINSYNNVLGDVHFLRAFMYFQLVKQWGDVPLRLSSNVTVGNLKLERTPKVEVYEQIEKDMLLAISLLPDASGVKSPGRVNKRAAQGILSRIYLAWAGNPINDTSKYAEAAKQAWAVVSSGQHSLNPLIESPSIGAPFDHPFPEVFKNIATNTYDLREIMWEVHFSFPADLRDNASTVGGWHGITSDTGSSYKRAQPRRYPLPTFFNSFEEDDTARRDWSISQFEITRNDEFIPIENELKYGVGKFRRYLMPSQSINNNYDAMNWPVIRYADVLLMLAESINETLANGGALPPGADISTAYEAVNQVRRRARILDPKTSNPSVDISGGGGETFRQQIRKERSWELCFENQRKQDLIRWGILEETVKQTGVELANIGVDVATEYFPAAQILPRHVLLPIPFAAEISQNPNVLNTDPTNNGYR